MTSPGEGGPLLLVQNEHDWTCGDDNLAQAYLGELARYHREAGLNVPTINANGLWQGMEGEVDCWSGSAQMLSNLRQLQTVRPDQPRLVVPFRVGQQRAWGRAPTPEDEPAPAVVARRLVEVLAAGGQFVIDPFIGGKTSGTGAGAIITIRTIRDSVCGRETRRSTSSASGRRGTTLSAAFARSRRALRVCSAILIRAGSTSRPCPSPTRARRSGAGGVSVVHVSGQQGGVAFVFASTSNRAGESQRRYFFPRV